MAADKSNQFLKQLNNIGSNPPGIGNKPFLNSINNQPNPQQQQQQQQNQQEKPEADKAFLERTQVKGILGPLVDSLHKNQPEDPISYICNYFDTLNQPDDLITSTLDRLKSINYLNPVFDDCLLDLYNTISRIKPNNKKNAKPQQLGEAYNSTVESFTSDISPFDLQPKIRKVLMKNDFDAISFQTFRSSIRIIAIYKEFLTQCRLLYQELESYSSKDYVNKAICELLLEQLKVSLKLLNSKSSNNELLLESLFLISPHGITELLKYKYAKIMAKTGFYIGLNDFLHLATQSFLDQVNKKINKKI